MRWRGAERRERRTRRGRRRGFRCCPLSLLHIYATWQRRAPHCTTCLPVCFPSPLFFPLLCASFFFLFFLNEILFIHFYFFSLLLVTTHSGYNSFFSSFFSLNLLCVQIHSFCSPRTQMQDIAFRTCTTPTRMGGCSAMTR